MLLMRSRFNRLFLVLFVVWAAYCLFIYPIQMAGKAFTHRDKDRQACFEAAQAVQLCLDRTEAEFRSGLYSGFGFKWDEGEFWSYGGYYRHMGWLLAAMIVVPALLAYLLAWGSGAIFFWIWRGPKTTNEGS